MWLSGAQRSLDEKTHSFCYRKLITVSCYHVHVPVPNFLKEILQKKMETGPRFKKLKCTYQLVEGDLQGLNIQSRVRKAWNGVP